MILNDDGHYWRLLRKMSCHDLNHYLSEPMEMREFITLFGNGRIFHKPGWILIASLEGEFTMYPEINTSSLRYARSIEMVSSDKSAFTRMSEILKGDNDEK